ncbi:citrinin biosynthesis oxidoreductase CtnB [Rhexocercosporidium sp. MPI-PUGE-AT-0058]|nr:citrinin biosynthesis oxidoreductase CtnB [Rhexocercosporidium sp. MPI-PUGE-AT-0058]
MSKSRILCLHGDGTNAAIFEAQTREVYKALEPDYELVYLNAPFECEAGYGVRPFFEDCGPFFRWTREGASDDGEDAHLFDGVIDVMSDLAFEYDDCESAFAGILGFSSSAGVVAGILKEQSFRQTYNLSPLLSMRFTFGILLNGHGSPLSLGARSESESESESDQVFAVSRTGYLIDIPSVHTFGRFDEWLAQSQALASCFAQDLRVCLEFENDHRVPVKPHDVRELVRGVRILQEKCNA